MPSDSTSPLAPLPLPQAKSPPRWLAPLICLALALVTAAAYWPVRNFQFIAFDDPQYVTTDIHVRSGLTPHEAGWVFGHFYYSNYHPLTMLSYMLDVQLFGLQPGPPHLVNLALHVVNAILLFLLLRWMTGPDTIWPSAFVAGAFALHPLHVESVAWISERKDVLSTFFWLTTMLFYVWYATRPGVGRYLLVVLAFVLGLLTKPMLVTLPFALLLVDYWPLKRPVRCGYWRIVVEKVPLLLLAAGASVLTMLAQRNAMASNREISLALRLGDVALGYGHYLLKTIWPTRLAPLYPISPHVPILPVTLAGASLIALTALVLTLRRPYATFGWLWFLGTLVPVIGFVQVGPQAMADRYTYVPLIGLFIALAWGVRELLMERSEWFQSAAVRLAVGSAALVLLGAWAIGTRAQVMHWRDSDALFAQALRIEPDNPIILNDIGWQLARSGQTEQAIPFYERALRYGQFAEGYANLAAALVSDHRSDEAVRIVEQGLARFPDNSELQRSAGVLCAELGQFDRALKHLDEAIRLNPDNIVARQVRTRIFVQSGRYDEALPDAKWVLGMQPDDPAALFNLAIVLAGRGQHREAIPVFQKLLRTQPNDADAHFQLGLSLIASGQDQVAAAQEHFREALRVRGDWVQPLNSLAWSLATAPDAQRRNGAEAVSLAEHANALIHPANPDLLDTLAAAYAEAGRFDDAAQTADRAATLAQQANRPPSAVAAMRHRAELYHQHKPFRDEARP